ncbi:EamA family transporter RarD [Arthrobacter sp. Sa2CUA1]|uniref:EamA family transporter RarD n=1 Tax=Arthrobacter gallicola TaxID=2762225 RepID=A0ABR8USU0_9MICC|nr:EamA family transporter RarD [Arthrobacter gallicola]MBD7995574.1 EamA family transporter RarD [Arthrobacter gallicola]
MPNEQPPGSPPAYAASDAASQTPQGPPAQGAAGAAPGTTPEGGSPGAGTRRATDGRISGSGLLFGIGAYGIWGFLPLYFLLLEPAGPVEIVAARVVFSLVFCAVLLTVMRSWRRALTAARDLRMLGTLSLAAVLIGVNWLVFSWAVLNGHAVEAALGYFINPLVSVLLGVFLLKERLRPLQWAAILVGFIAVLVLAFAYGNVPWVALSLAFSFGFYGLVKKGVGGKVDAVSSLSIETAVLTPLAVAVLLVMGAGGTGTLFSFGPAHFWLLAASGIATAVPLIFFGAAASRLPLTMVGMLQYLAPVLQFIMALIVFQEAMPPERWAGFGLVWLALAMLSIDMMGSPRRARLRRAQTQAV